METSDAKKHSLRKLSLLVWKESLRMPFLSLILILSIISGEAVFLIIPYFIQRLVDGVIDGQLAALNTSLIILYFIVPITGFGLLGNLFWRVSGYIGGVVEATIKARLTSIAHVAVFKQSYRFFTDRFTGSLVRTIRSLGDSGGEILDAYLWDFLPILVSIVLGIWLFSVHSPILGAILFVWMIFILAANFLMNRLKLPFDNSRAEAFSRVVGMISDAVSNAININLFTGHREELRRVNEGLEDSRKKAITAWHLGVAGNLVQNILVFICEFAILSASIVLWKAGQMSVGEVVFVQGVLLTIFRGTSGLGRVMRKVFEAGADAHEILEIMDMTPEVRDLKSAKKLDVKRARIQFENVSFQYAKDSELIVLKDFTLDIKPKEKIALVGPSGAGKSTITKLLFRFFDVNFGKILIDGQDISKVTQDSLRSAIAFVPQEPILFHRTLLENIRYGRRDAMDEEVKAAAKAAHADAFISAFPNGYNTLVGERGVKLSGGERQRIAIARAILRDAPILVLDEATSSLDSESEALIQDALRDLMKNKTVIAIAHRLSTIMEMDRIIVMEAGRIVDEGTHASLKRKVGTYQKLWNIQVGGFKV